MVEGVCLRMDFKRISISQRRVEMRDLGGGVRVERDVRRRSSIISKSENSMELT